MMHVIANMRWLLPVLLVAVGAAVGPFAHSASAQGRGLDSPRERKQSLPGDRQAQPANAGEIQRMLDGYELMQAHERLQLSEDQFSRFLPRLKVLQDVRRRAQMQRNRIIQELRRTARDRADAADEARIREQIRALDDHDARSAAEIRQAKEAVDQTLDPHQQARFRIFEEMMEQRKIELLMRARQGDRPQNRPQPPPIP
jgi:hypothetical protein